MNNNNKNRKMKNSITIFIVAALLFACSDDKKPKYKYYKKAHAHEARYIAATNPMSENNSVKFSYRIKPSESMAVGVEMPKFNAIRDENKLPQKYDNINADLKDIMRDGRYVGRYKVGTPYKIEDIFYYPQEYDDYEEVGVSSWYGDDFHGKQTSNGEIYNSGALTAAHQTLPLPSMVRVTNLENGKSVLVRVNDRGPFAKSRIIDVSERAAELLGYREKGTTTVKVEFLPKETEELLMTLNIKNK